MKYFIIFISCISARLAPQISSLKDEYTFHFSNFLITSLCNSSTNYWFNITSLLTLLPENFLLKNL